MDNDEDDYYKTGVSPSDNKFIDELTMKLLTNQTNYAKYLSKNDTEKYEEQQQFIMDCNDYYHQIMNITKDLCKQKENNYGSDVNQAFDNYARIVIRYLEVKQKSDEQQKEYSDDLIGEQFPDSIEDEDSINDYILHPNKGTMDMFVKKK